MAKRSIDKIIPDLQRKVEADWNRFIKTVASDLATDENKGGVSPAYTGFFASSWEASLRPHRSPSDKLTSDKQPWFDIKKQKDKDRSVQAQIKPRHKIPTFSVKDTVYLGSTVEYAAYAFEKPSISNYVQGELRYLIQQRFGDEKAVSVRKGGELT
nr:HK97-gp10_like tail component [uncultured Mediterranean phage uvMED]